MINLRILMGIQIILSESFTSIFALEYLRQNSLKSSTL